MCRDCDTASYNMSCINCMANWILRLEKSSRLFVIEGNGKHDIAELKALIIKKSGRS